MIFIIASPCSRHMAPRREVAEIINLGQEAPLPPLRYAPFVKGNAMPDIPRPAPGKRPRSAEVERLVEASPAALYDAWTTRFDRWFAQPGTLSMVREEGRAWFFYNREDWGRHPHYGRFLALRPDELVETTWLTGDGSDEGTAGAETVLKIELEPQEGKTLLRLTHSGFASDKARDAHAENWPLALDSLEKALEGC
jgi:uncharacterized protein YndB with AHSA1/START domain